MAALPLNVSIASTRPSFLSFPPKRFGFSLRPDNGIAPKDSLFLCSTTTPHHQTTSVELVERRSADYPTSICDDAFLKRMNSVYKGEVCQTLAEILKENARKLLASETKRSEVALLELIDDIQRLGMAYIFETDIKIALDSIRDVKMDNNLHATALRFRIFRQYGFGVSQDAFKNFKGSDGNFMESLSNDVKGILSLYEASHLAMVGEEILDEAKHFSRRHLNDASYNIDPTLLELVNHALEFPLHINSTRIEALWYIDIYSKREDANLNLLRLAKLDYNMVQAIHQEDLISVGRWWKGLGLMEILPFARDNLVVCYFASMETVYEPEHRKCREGITKINSFINAIDDVYDVYSTLDEAKLFTDVVERWDVNAAEKLPAYMRLCFYALHNTINEIGYQTLMEKGLNVVPFLRKMWVYLCKSYMVEAKWFHTGYTPSLEEYLENGWRSISGPLLMLHIYVFMCPKISSKVLNHLTSYNDFSHSFGMILRLIDDLGTYENESMRGDVVKSIKCYMHDKGAIEQVAREYIMYLTEDAWKKMNREMWTESPLPQAFIGAVVNLAAAITTGYHYGDPFYQDSELKDKIMSLLVNNMPLSL